MKPLKRLGRKVVYEGKILKVCQDEIETPSGAHVQYDFIMHQGAAAAVPVMEDGKIIMVHQYRNALDRYTLEIPAGGLESKEEPTKLCAMRECEEETGYRPQNAEFLLSIYTTVAFCNEKIDIYVVDGLVETRQKLDEEEYVEWEAYSVHDLLKKIEKGEIQDSKTVAAILAYYRKYCIQ